jgi:hypothetical protein
MKARNKKTGQELEWDGKAWRKPKLPGVAVPADHWAAVPGQAWSAHYRRMLAAGNARPLKGLDESSLDPRLVDPPKYPD